MINLRPKLFFPSFPVKRSNIIKYLKNLEQEIKANIFTENELKVLNDEKLYGKYIDIKKREFFLYHFVPLWEYSIVKIFITSKSPKILELGCGVGTSSLLYSSLGAEVIGIDLNKEMIDLCNKRKNLYNSKYNKFKIDFIQSDSFLFPYAKYGNFDVVFSLFAFNLMQPSELLIRKIISNISRNGILLIIDGNQENIYSKLIKSRRRPGVLKACELATILIINNFEIISLKYHCFIPPVFFKTSILQTIGVLLEKVIQCFRLTKFFGVSYSLTAVRR